MTFRPALLFILPASLVVTPEAGHHPPQQPERTTTISVGESAAQAGAPVVAPLTLAPAEGIEIGSITVRLAYPKALLSFVKIEPSGLALAAGAVVQSKVDAGPDAKSSTLHVRVFTGPDSGRTLPPGPLAYLGFKIAQSAKPETVIALSHTAEALSAGEPRQPVKPLIAGKATIMVARPPVPACFFYMH